MKEKITRSRSSTQCLPKLEFQEWKTNIVCVIKIKKLTWGYEQWVIVDSVLCFKFIHVRQMRLALRCIGVKHIAKKKNLFLVRLRVLEYGFRWQPLLDLHPEIFINIWIHEFQPRRFLIYAMSFSKWEYLSSPKVMAAALMTSYEIPYLVNGQNWKKYQK